MSTQPNTQAQMEGLATLLVLTDEIRKLTNIREFGFFTTNETHRLVQYHTAFLWKKNDITGATLLAQSGTPEIDVHAPNNQWLLEKIKQLAARNSSKDVTQFKLSELESNDKESYSAIIAETLPDYLLWCPLFSKSNHVTGGLIILRETPFSDAEIKMLKWLIASYQYTWQILTKQKPLINWEKAKQKPYFITIGFAIILILFFPIRLSVLGTATVVPKNPVLINAPMEGVIKSFSVSPGQQVQAGQVLLTLDKSDLESEADVNNKELLLTQAKLRTAINQGFSDKDINAEVPILKAQLAIDMEHINYTNSLLKKTEIKSPIDGIVVFDSKEDWVGQPVKTGERILVVTDPKEVKLKIMLPISNIIPLEIDADGDFFLYGQFNAIPVKVKTLGYNAKLMPNHILAYELSADFVETENLPQLGSQGSIRLYSNRVPFIYYLIRRPIQAIRQTWGL